jgi:hypothetical protein
VYKVDIVDMVASLGMKARSSSMSSSAAGHVKKPERTVTAFIERVRSLNETAQEVKKIPAKAFRGRYPQQATTYVTELTKLEQTIRQLKTRFADDRGEEHGSPVRAAPIEPPPSSAVQDGTDSVRATLERMVRQGKLLSSTEFASQLDWTRQALSRALTSNRVFYVDFKGDRYFPAFYAEPNYQRSHLEAVTKVLGDLPGGAKLQFFLNGKGSLGGATPLEDLAQGKLQKVKDVAAAFAEVR